MAPPVMPSREGFVVGGTPLHQRVETYLGALTVTQGALIGDPFRVLPWQKRFLRGALRPGRFESSLTMGRGGGKSTFIGGLVCAALDGLLASPNSEVVIVAASLRQAGVIFRHVQRFLADRIATREFKLYDAVNRQAIYNPSNGVLVELKGANPATLHGLAPSLIVVDEMAQVHLNKLPALLAALDTSLGKVPDSRIWKIGTRAATADHPFEVALATADYSQTHAARPGDPPFQKRTWIRACPSVAYFPDLEAKIRAEARRAKASEDALAHFRALRLNLGCPDTVENTLVSVDAWKAAEGDRPARGPCVWGVDLGGTAASSAVAAFWPVTGRLEALAAFPAVPMSLAERGLRDAVGRLYVDCAARGELLTCPGRTVSPAFLLREALNRFGRPAAVASDRWREGELRDGLQGAGVPAAALAMRGQGFKDGGEDVRQFRRLIADRKARPVVSLLLRSAMAEARVVGDPAGNAKLSKGSQGGRRMRARDDAAAAAILAVAEGARRAATAAPRRRRFAVVGGR